MDFIFGKSGREKTKRFYLVKKVDNVDKSKKRMVVSGKEPGQAAKKALTKLCKRACKKKIILLEIQSNEKGTAAKSSKGSFVPIINSTGLPNEYTYTLRKQLREVPLEIEINGKIIVYKYETVTV